MCVARPVAIALAPLVIRDLPAEIARDGARHTWPSYSRTLQRVVIEHRPLPDLLAARAPVTLLYGTHDREVPIGDAGALNDELRSADIDASLQVVPGDHHLAVRRPDVVAATIATAPASAAQPTNARVPEADPDS